MRVLTVVGARPQFVKCAVVSRVLRQAHEEVLVHTGQHHDYGMSTRFFEELAIPEPALNLGIAGGSHGQMTGRMLEAIENVLLAQPFDWVLVYGDTNSTLAAALAATKQHVRVAHVEAGLRSFNRRMPEEVNRVLTDHVATLLLCPTENAERMLAREGITAGVHVVGDVMYDSVLANVARARQSVDCAALFRSVGFSPDGPFAVATLHRQENTDDEARIVAILGALSRIGVPVLLPLHPRTRAVLHARPDIRQHVGPAITICDPLGYFELLATVAASHLVLTDSGGLQKEAFFLDVRCVTLRDETEWVETVEAGANTVVGADADTIVAAASRALSLGRLSTLARSGFGPFGDGHAAERIVRLLETSGPSA